MNRVDDTEMQIAEIKSRLNKLQQYRKKIENQVKENNQKAIRLAKEGQKDRALICVRHKKAL